jgi:hypothetical protein
MAGEPGGVSLSQGGWVALYAAAADGDMVSREVRSRGLVRSLALVAFLVFGKDLRWSDPSSASPRLGPGSSW